MLERGLRNWFRDVADLRALIKQMEDALGRGHRRLHEGVLIAEVLDRLEEALHIGQKSGQRAHRECPFESPVATTPEDKSDADRGDHADDRGEQRLIPDGMELRLQLLIVETPKMLEVEGLAAQQLHDAHAAEILLQISVDPRQLDPDIAVDLTHRAAKHQKRADQ
jgi:hypothetical protein